MGKAKLPKAATKKLKEKDHSPEIFEIRLECENCNECERTAFSILDDKGKIKDKSKDKIKEDFYKEKDSKNMPDPENPEIWYCDEHAT